MINRDALLRAFHAQFSRKATWSARAPGRVNLIGEHTDYNGGLMLPAAIECETAAAAALHPGAAGIAIWSVNYEAGEQFDPRHLPDPAALRGWPRYVAAVIGQFTRRGIDLPAMQIAIDGDVPRGSGLSSSASFEVCLATLFNAVADAGLSPLDIAFLCQAAEHSPFVGVKCGIMDQAASALCEKDHALLIDARDVASARSIAFPSDKAAILIIDTRKRRGLVDSEYNRRRAECVQALDAMNALAGASWQTLGDVPDDAATESLPRIAELPRCRARHVLSENARVRGMAAALEAGRVDSLAAFMGGSHASLRDDYEVSCTELDAAAEIAGQQPGCLGARMTGAGFGGCAVALFEAAAIAEATLRITTAFEQRIGVAPGCLVSRPSAGAQVMQV